MITNGESFEIQPQMLMGVILFVFSTFLFRLHPLPFIADFVFVAVNIVISITIHSTNPFPSTPPKNSVDCMCMCLNGHLTIVLFVSSLKWQFVGGKCRKISCRMYLIRSKVVGKSLENSIKLPPVNGTRRVRTDRAVWRRMPEN